MNGAVQLFNDRPIPGPYTQPVRETWLRKVLLAQSHIRENGPPEVQELELITLEELEEIRRLWVVEKHEIEDTLPHVYEDVTGEEYPGRRMNDNLVMGAPEVNILRDICGSDTLHFQLTRELLSVEKRHKSMLRRAGLFEALEDAFKRSFYDNEEDAVNRARERRETLDQAQEQALQETAPMTQGPSDLVSISGMTKVK
jgi:DNA sulfur modification protein DndC